MFSLNWSEKGIRHWGDKTPTIYLQEKNLHKKNTSHILGASDCLVKCPKVQLSRLVCFLQPEQFRFLSLTSKVDFLKTKVCCYSSWLCFIPFLTQGNKDLASKLSSLPLVLQTSLSRLSSFNGSSLSYLWSLLRFCFWWHVRHQRQYLQTHNCGDFLKTVYLYGTLRTRLYHSALLKMCAGEGWSIHVNWERRNTER